MLGIVSIWEPRLIVQENFLTKEWTNFAGYCENFMES